MHAHSLARHRHHHRFLRGQGSAPRRTRWVLGLTLATMALEVAAGAATGSMALLADGWHMATHAAAFGIALFAYRFAARHADNPRFSFGTGKVGVLGGFASSVALAAAALMMAVESVLRLVSPQPILFGEAIAVAALGLVVNLASAWLLAGVEHGHHHEHENENENEEDAHGRQHHHGHDHNLRGALLHVLADALTSVLAIAALLLGRLYGWVWLDPLMGLAGAALILRWAWGLLRETALILLDGGADEALREQVRAAVEADGDARLADLHLWHLGPDHLAAALAVVADHPRPPEHYKSLLSALPGLSHLLVEVNPCADGPCGEERPPLKE
jgi:cation diffusion facilitator family transporter